MKKKFLLLLSSLSFFLVGCSNTTHVDIKQVVEIKSETKIIKNGNIYKETNIGTAVRWNEEYLVTVKHINFTKGEEILTPYDIKFIKSSPDNVSIPFWRNPNAKENIRVIGFNLKGNIVEHNGQDIDVYREEENGEVNRFSTAMTEGGQSGGIILGDDGYAIGILVGLAKIKDPNSSREFKGKGNTFSIYIPYDFILLAWEDAKKVVISNKHEEL